MRAAFIVTILPWVMKEGESNKGSSHFDEKLSIWSHYGIRDVQLYHCSVKKETSHQAGIADNIWRMATKIFVVQVGLNVFVSNISNKGRRIFPVKCTVFNCFHYTLRSLRLCTLALQLERYWVVKIWIAELSHCPDGTDMVIFLGGKVWKRHTF